MKPRTLPLLMAFSMLLAATGLAQVPASSDQVWIADILASPARYWNTTVTVIGQVMDVTANPPGTTRGTYTLMDDSSQAPLAIRTRDLPPVGHEYAVTGVIVQDPAQANVPLLDELERADPGTDATLRMLLIGGAVLLGVLLVVLVAMLMRSRPAPAAAGPAVTPAPGMAATMPPAPADFGATRREAAAAAPTRKIESAAADRTRVFTSLGYEIAVEKGPDKGAVHRLHKQVTTIGRRGGRSNDIELGDDTVSKEQASLTYDSASHSFSLSNQSATNPTRVNGRVAAEPIVLDPDALIEMGSTALKFRKE